MEKYIVGIGKTVKCMEKVKLYGLIRKNMLVTIIKIKSMVKACLCGLMGKYIKDNGRMVNNMVKESYYILIKLKGQGYG
jgi:hypothetical protein